ncbi:hypothetical protein MAR_006119 [Mya arenaria]|uniref:Uncharacterized protein n=1 Tax=Mya arenaria TaxID=6604 RepID=A0ABY7D8P1_MYAAR|nr:hypothetical protein MAR_006119 [Mya arenaria]
MAIFNKGSKNGNLLASSDLRMIIFNKGSKNGKLLASNKRHSLRPQKSAEKSVNETESSWKSVRVLCLILTSKTAREINKTDNAEMLILPVKEGRAHLTAKGPMCCSRYSVTFHYVRPEDMYNFHHLLYHTESDPYDQISDTKSDPYDQISDTKNFIHKNNSTKFSI